MQTMPPVWDDTQLQDGRRRAIERFRAERTSEPVGTYSCFYDDAYRTVSQVIDQTGDLLRLREHAKDVLTDGSHLEVARYLASPPLSEDDLQSLSGTASLAASRLKANPQAVSTIIDFILQGLDPRRFPWVAGGRTPTPEEKHAASMATAAILATRRTETWRRGNGRRLEQQVKDYLTARGMVEIDAEPIVNLTQGPMTGEFCGETPVVGARTDIAIGLGPGRLALIECKVSNSEVNSHKRLVHECGEKAQRWVHDLGTRNCVPIAVLSGCYSLGDLKKAQDIGLALVWADDLSPLEALVTDATQPG